MKAPRISSIFVIAIAIFFGRFAGGQEATEVGPCVKEMVMAVENPRAKSNYLATLNYSVVDFPVPSKFGVTLGIVSSSTRTWELEYMKGSLSVPGGFRDLASINDTRLAVIGRQYYGSSFHLAYGVSYFDFSANIGDTLMNGLSGGAYPNIDMMTIQGFGLNVGIGNTWVFKKNITLGVDWVSWAQPLVVTKRNSDYLKYASNENDKKNVEDTMKLVSYLPRLALMNVHLGMLF